MARDIHGGPGEAPETGATATTFPTKHLPPVTYRDMPEPLSLRRVLGPGVIAAGIGLASGEFILWPYITSQVGLVFLWAAIVGVVTQFFINMEIERYTLATGETALTGFSRYWRHWGLVFAVLTYFANLWPGWAWRAGSSSSTPTSPPRWGWCSSGRPSSGSPPSTS